MKRVKTFTLILPLLFAILFQNCASFDKEFVNPNPLKTQNLHKIEGTYDIANIVFDSIKNKKIPYFNTHTNFFKEIDRKLIKDTLGLNNANDYKFELKILSQKKIKISYLKNGEIIRERDIKTKLKKDGFLYLSNKNLQFLGVPYIFGAFDIKKTRLTLSKNNNLIFDVSNTRSGAGLLIVFLTYKEWQYKREYKRISLDP
ncbi:hypothetical protein ACPX19_06150 [Winogradskyella sp. HB-48]|uniref:hypothetical protein n=1 Tax=Winogradskyella sp. HB-48 TaxID=3416808 RepID=UPI003CF07E69